VSAFTATPGDTQNSLSWTNPTDSDFAGVKIMFKTTGYPTSQTDGTQVYDGMGTSTVHTGLTNGVTYYYKAFTYDEVNNYSSGAQASATPYLPNPPGAPTVTAPTSGSTATTVTPTITWTGDAHDQYQVRISLQNDSNTSTGGWDSGAVVDSGNSAVSGTLRNYSLYYVFVRLHNSAGWGNWSAAGHNFIVNTSSTGGTVYLGAALPSTLGWAVYDTASYENGGSITSVMTTDGGYSVWRMRDNSTSNRCKERYTVTDVNFDTGASVAARIRAASLSGTPTYNLGISNNGAGGMFLRIYTNSVRLVDINGNNRGSYSVSSGVYHKYQLTVKNATPGNNATAAWRVYVDGTQRITWTGAGVAESFDGFFAGHAGTGARGYWYFDYIAGRSDGEFSPSQWDPVY